MSMVKIVVKSPDGVVATITWSQEYGLAEMTADGYIVESHEVEPRSTVMVPVRDLPMYQDQRAGLALVPGITDLQLPDEALAERTVDPPREPTPAELAKHRSGGLPDCFSCEHPAHPGVTCTWQLTGPNVEKGRVCDCLMYVS